MSLLSHGDTIVGGPLLLIMGDTQLPTITELRPFWNPQVEFLWFSLAPDTTPLKPGPLPLLREEKWLLGPRGGLEVRVWDQGWQS